MISEVEKIYLSEVFETLLNLDKKFKHSIVGCAFL